MTPSFSSGSIEHVEYTSLPPRAKLCERHLLSIRDCWLARLQPELLRAQPPANFRMPRKRARAGAWSIDQNSVEIAAERKRLRGVEFEQAGAGEAETLELRLGRPQAVCVAVGSHNQGPWLPCCAHQRRRLASRRGAQIKHAITRPHAKKQRDHLRRLVLNRNLAGSELLRAHRAAAADRERRLQ